MNAVIRECPFCHRATRPARMPAGDLDIPTVLRCRGELCRKCHGRSGPQHVATDQHEYNLAGLRSFLARRRDRETAMLRRTYYEERMSA